MGAVCYAVVESHFPRRFGILGRSESPEAALLAAPFCRDRAPVAHTVAYLNQAQVPLPAFKARILEGRGFPPEGPGPSPCAAGRP